MKKRSALRLLLVAAMIGLTSIAVSPGTASATGTFLHNNHGSYVPACGWINCPYGPGYLVPNYRSFTMYCWADGNWRYANDYWTNRWFKGNIAGVGVQWVPSNYVYFQTRVGHC